MTVTVLDSTDLAGIIADAGVALDQPEPKVDKESDKVDETTGKVDKPADSQEDPDDIEGDDGLTPRQKRDYTQGMQKTIGKKHRQRMEAEEFAAAQYAERKLAEDRATRLEQELSTLKAKVTPVEDAQKKAPEKPRREDFKDEYAFVDAMIDYGVDERLREKAAEEAAAAAEEAKEKLKELVSERLDRAIELVPDWKEAVDAAAKSGVRVPHYMSVYMEKSEMVAELAYHFAKNQELLLSLAKLPPDEQLVKLGKIESTLSPFGSEEEKPAPDDTKSSREASNGQAKPAPSADTGDIPSKPRGKAAPVITPLEGSGSSGIRKDSADMNIREAIDDYSKRNKLNLNVRKRH